MKKLINLEVVENRELSPSVNLLIMRPEEAATLPELIPGQFVNLQVDCKDVFLRRPISVCDYDNLNNSLWLAVRKAGKGTEWLANTPKGTVINSLLPLGNGFTLPIGNKHVLLVGGGVGVAPLLFLARWLKMLDVNFEILIGAKTKDELLLVDEFKKLGKVHLSTDDGSEGSQGYIHKNPVLLESWDGFYVCGPSIMMKMIAAVAKERGIECQVSLENRMACGVGACLCCVEDTVDGNKCTCTDGPVFDIQELKW